MVLEYSQYIILNQTHPRAQHKHTFVLFSNNYLSEINTNQIFIVAILPCLTIE